MKTTMALLALATSVMAWGNTTTEIVTEYTTYCPEATTLTHGSSTITVTGPTTLTLTGTSTSTIVAASTAYYSPCPSGTAPAVPNKSVGTVGTAPSNPYTTAPLSKPTTTSFPVTGAAGALEMSGFAAAAVAGLAVYVL